MSSPRLWFWHHLARTVTHSTVQECMRRMTAREFVYWRALYRLEPWGNEWRMTEAIAASNLAPWNKAAGRALHKLFPQSRPQRMTDEQIEKVAAGFAAQHPKRFRRGSNRRPENDPVRQ